MNLATTITPSSTFQSLICEHHHALLFTSRLSQGLNNHTDTDTLVKYVRWCWKNHIRSHFFQEEKIILPYLPGNDLLGKKLKEDHSEIMELMISINNDVDAFDLASLAAFIESHIRWEEKVFFGYLESKLSPSSLAEISERLKHHLTHDEIDWTVKFWEK